jgi:hypothetical protein
VHALSSGELDIVNAVMGHGAGAGASLNESASNGHGNHGGSGGGGGDGGAGGAGGGNGGSFSEGSVHLSPLSDASALAHGGGGAAGGNGGSSGSVIDGASRGERGMEAALRQHLLDPRELKLEKKVPRKARVL